MFKYLNCTLTYKCIHVLYKKVVQGALWHGSRMEKIEDHGYKNFVFPNQGNKQARCSFHKLFLH